MIVTEFIGYNNNDAKELNQINRVKDIVIKWGSQCNFTEMYIFFNINYFHEGLNVEWNSDEWNGEIDMIVLCRNYFIIFELKNKKGIIKGQTKRGQWKVKYENHERFKSERDYYSQCSRMKTFFSRNYWPKNIQLNIMEKSKLRPDVLLIFQNGSDLSNVKFTPSKKIIVEDYNKILEKVNKKDANFMKQNFHYDDQQKIYLVNYGVDLIDEDILERIYNYCGMENRVKKWFHVLTEDKLGELLPFLGSDSFMITDKIVNILIKDFKLIKTNEYLA
jgi:hypothetical protein